MNLENYTERMRGFIQSAQSKALSEGHQQFTPEHILKVLLDDEQGLAASLIDRAGGESNSALLATELILSKIPKVSGGSGGVYLSQELAKVFEQADKIAKPKRLEIRLSPLSGFCWHWRWKRPQLPPIY